jgi:Polysaccharide lyase
LVLGLLALGALAGGLTACGGSESRSPAGDERLSPAGLGPVRLGTSRAQVADELGRGRTTRVDRRHHLRSAVYEGNFLRVDFRDNVVIGVATNQRSVSTPGGFGVGTPELSLRRRLSTVRCRGRPKSRRCVLAGTGSRTTFRIREGRVAAIHVAQSCGTPLADRPRGPRDFTPARPARAAQDSVRADFETGDFSQWDQLDGNLDDKDRYFRLLQRPAPVFEGRHSFQSTVDGEAVGSDEPGQRTMLLVFASRQAQRSRSLAYEGSEAWYRSHVFFPGGFRPSPGTAWNWVVQWHNWPDGVCCPNLALSVDARRGCEALSLRAMGGGDAGHPVERSSVIKEENPAGRLQWFAGDPVLLRDHWYDSLVHVRWSTSPSKGLVEWWLDGHLIVSKPFPTLYWYDDDNVDSGRTPGPGQAYYMEGYYRPARLPSGDLDTAPASVIFDGARWGPTRAAAG